MPDSIRPALLLKIGIEGLEGAARCPVPDREAILVDDIGRDAADNTGHQLLWIHRTGAHGESGHLDIRVEALKLGDLRGQPGRVLADLQPPDDEFRPVRRAGPRLCLHGRAALQKRQADHCQERRQGASRQGHRRQNFL